MIIFQDFLQAGLIIKRRVLNRVVHALSSSDHHDNVYRTIHMPAIPLGIQNYNTRILRYTSTLHMFELIRTMLIYLKYIHFVL